MKRLAVGALVALLSVMTAAADTLTLTSGSSVEGTYLGGDSREVRFLGANGRVATYSVNDVAAIRFGETTETPAAEAAAAEPISAPQPVDSASDAVIPDGTVVTVRMIDSIDSDVTGVGDRYRASLEEALVMSGFEIAPKGADAVVQVAKVEQAGRVRGRDEVALELAALVIDGEEIAVQSNFAELESKSKTAQTAKTAGAGAAIGALIGVIAGGGKGAAIGAATGGGAGTVYSATRGTSVQVPSETLLTFVVRGAPAP